MSDINSGLEYFNTIGLGGIAYFIYYLFKGLSQKVGNLEQTIKEQDKTLSVVRERAAEMNQWRKEYKEMVSDFHEIGKKLDLRREALIKELEIANREKDTELAQTKASQLAEVELRKKSWLWFLEERCKSQISIFSDRFHDTAE